MISWETDVSPNRSLKKASGVVFTRIEKDIQRLFNAKLIESQEEGLFWKMPSSKEPYKIF